ncbi:hypothetical protein JRO89_XS02G0257400 [Xanthoceras sorbifolium]|uniref:HMA domain-containing protein n=1 Tax=Xanthoceras sorbifolium TaxID=99658 RepID=A0ABQ8IH00_9ROSI|nr:hypothetical protein JRO89_XS02G0257400 [Xanthoceras sorbifolium]
MKLTDNMFDDKIANANISHSSSDTPPDPPPDQFATIVKNTDELELGNIPSNTPDDQIDNVDDINPWNPIADSVPTTAASEIPQPSTLRQRRKQPETESSRLSKGKTASEQYDDEVKNTYETQSNMLSKGYVNKKNMLSKGKTEFWQSDNQVEYICVEVLLIYEPYNEKAENKVMKTISTISGVASVQMDKKNKKITVTGDMDPVAIVNNLRKLCRAEIVSVGPAKEQPEKEEQKDR